MALNPLDWAIVLLLTYSTVRAAVRGFVRVACSLAGAIVGFGAAMWGYAALAPQLGGLVTSPALQRLAAFALLLSGVVVLAGLLGALLDRTSRALGLSWVNRLAGAAVGLLRGAVLLAALLSGLVAFLPSAPWLASSRLATPLLHAVDAVSFGMPAALRARLLHRGT